MHLPSIAAVIVAESRSRALDRARRAGRLASRQIAAFRQRASFLWELRSFVRESLLAILVSLVIVVLAGMLFGSLRDALVALPGLTLLVPGALAMRGNVFASMGARLGTALHTGELSSRTRGSPRLREEVIVVLVQLFLGAIVLAVIGRVTALVVGLSTVTLMELVVTAVMGSLVAGTVELLVTVEVAISAHRKGWDPDNVTAPVITAVADLVSIPSLLGAAFLVVWIPEAMTQALFVVFLFVTMALVVVVGRGGHVKASEILSASVPVLLVVLLIVLVPALVLEHLVEDLVSTPSFLVMLPPFIAIAGNLGAILASRLSSAAHLGLITVTGPPDRLVVQNMGVIGLLSVLTFGALAVLVHLLTVATGIGSPGLGPLLVISLVGGLFVTAATSFAAYRVTVFTFRKGDDPDNVVIPVITSTMDALGTGLLVVLFMALVF